jgi:predicted nuclease of predicted toxin-antitoxin system
VRFLIDAQLPPALAQTLRALGHEADHVNAIGLGAAPDMTIWLHAVNSGAVIITKDQDFASLARGKPPGTSVVWIRLGNTTNTALWRKLEPHFPELVSALESGDHLIEVT